MNGNAQKLIKYLDGASKRFIIPVYQRNYDWKMEHCKQLYDDLVKIIRQNRKSHFFGSIVSVQSESGTMEEFLIIDGQQRLIRRHSVFSLTKMKNISRTLILR